jgi:hypothetical protein
MVAARLQKRGVVTDRDVIEAEWHREDHRS